MGSSLLKALEDEAKVFEFHKLVLSYIGSNSKAKYLYQKHNYRTVGVYYEHGKINGEWVDIVLMEKLLY